MSAQANDLIRVICISDTHNAQPSVPDGDILIHAGDLSYFGSADEIRKAAEWLSSLPHPIKLVIAGNHDKALDAKLREESRAPFDDALIDWLALGITYLEHSSTKVTVRGHELSVFGSPFTPELGPGAFQYPQARLVPGRAREIWEAIPVDTDILITHTPPYAHLDTTSRGQLAGCPALLDRLWEVRPCLHVYGHIHYGSGEEKVSWNTRQRLKEVWLESDKQVLGMVSRWYKGTSSSGLGSSRRPTHLINASMRPSHFSGFDAKVALI
jgi:predicted phosphohydrolase